MSSIRWRSPGFLFLLLLFIISITTLVVTRTQTTGLGESPWAKSWSYGVEVNGVETQLSYTLVSEPDGGKTISMIYSQNREWIQIHLAPPAVVPHEGGTYTVSGFYFGGQVFHNIQDGTLVLSPTTVELFFTDQKGMKIHWKMTIPQGSSSPEVNI